jgi:hypothetical protein
MLGNPDFHKLPYGKAVSIQGMMQPWCIAGHWDVTSMVRHMTAVCLDGMTADVTGHTVGLLGQDGCVHVMNH